ncbi:MAG TPA: hypothetical protein PK263_06785, partial [bacterium]|nr:hypothetical protein [bacterium]
SLIIAIFSMIGYLGYQVMSFVGSPNLKVVTPVNNSVIESDATNISGVTEVDTVLTVNNEKISISNDGHFSANVKLQRGINVIKVRAENKTKKETTEVLTVEYRPKTAELMTSINN